MFSRFFFSHDHWFEGASLRKLSLVPFVSALDGDAFVADYSERH